MLLFRTLDARAPKVEHLLDLHARRTRALRLLSRLLLLRQILLLLLDYPHRELPIVRLLRAAVLLGDPRERARRKQLHLLCALGLAPSLLDLRRHRQCVLGRRRIRVTPVLLEAEHASRQRLLHVACCVHAALRGQRLLVVCLNEFIGRHALAAQVDVQHDERDQRNAGQEGHDDADPDGGDDERRRNARAVPALILDLLEGSVVAVELVEAEDGEAKMTGTLEPERADQQEEV